MTAMYATLADMPCRIFNANGVCPRDFMGGCPYKHDWLLWAKTWDHKKRLYVDGFTVINNEIVPNSAIPAVETKFTMITTKVPRQPMTPIVASKFSGMDVKPSACSLAPATTTSVQVKNLTLPQMISNRTTCTSSIASASPLSLKTSFASANDQLVQVKDTASSQINKSSRPFASQLASGSSGMVLSNFHSIQDLSNTSIPWPQPTPKNFSTNVHTAQVKKPALAEAVSNNTKSSAPLAPEDSNIALNGARPVHSMKPFAQSAKNVKKVSSPRHQAHNAQQPKKSTTAPTAPSQSTSLPHLKWEPGLPCLEFAPGPAPGHLRKCTILTVEESIDRKSWDCMPSDWEQFGHAQYSPEDYEKIIAPYMHELERGIVSKEFWYQNLGVSQTNTVSGAATTFLQFGTLPQELQDRIWTYAATDGENTLVIGYHYDSHYTAINHSRIVNEKMIGLSGSPPLLRVCRDARQTTLGLHRHHVVFGANGGPGQHFFNFSKDRLFLHCKLTQEYRHLISAMDGRQRFYVQRLAIPFEHVTRSDEKVLGHALCRGFLGLKQLYLMAGDGKCDKRNVRRDFCKVRSWFRVIWAEYHHKTPTRAKMPPEVHIEYVPSYKAKHLDFQGACSSNTNVMYLYKDY